MLQLLYCMFTMKGYPVKVLALVYGLTPGSAFELAAEAIAAAEATAATEAAAAAEEAAAEAAAAVLPGSMRFILPRLFQLMGRLQERSLSQCLVGMVVVAVLSVVCKVIDKSALRFWKYQ